MVTRIQGFMVPSPISLRGSFSNSLLYRFPCKVTQKFLCGRLRRLSNVAIARAFDEFSIENHERESINMYRPKGLDILNLMEQRRMQANHQVYLWPLEGCLKSGSLVDAKRLHGKILKSGFGGEHLNSFRLLEVYVTHGDLDDAVLVFDDFPERNVSDWNRLISSYAQKKLTRQVLGLFAQMLEENVNSDEITFAHI